MKQDVIVKTDSQRPLGITGWIDNISVPEKAKAGDVIKTAASGSTSLPNISCHLHTRLLDGSEVLGEADGPEFATGWLPPSFDFDDSRMEFHIPSDVSSGTYDVEVSLQVKMLGGWYNQADEKKAPIEIVGAGVILYTLTIGVEGTGRTKPEQGEHNYESGETVQVQAIPGEDQKFERWIGDVQDNNAESTSIVMDSDKTLTAVFTEREWFDPFLDALYYAGGAIGVGVGLYSTYQAIVMRNKLMYIPAAAGYGGGGYLIYKGTKRA